MTQLEIDPAETVSGNGKRRAVQNGSPTRPSTRGDLRADQFVGRDGEVLSRTQTNQIDPYHVPPEIIPVGWSYQWNTVSIYNNQDLVIGQNMRMYGNGWRPVPAERHDGMFVPRGTKGAIIRDGMRLEERPQGMTDLAVEESKSVARRQISDQHQSVMGNVKKAMRDGMEMSGKYRGTGGNMKMQIDPGLDIPPPTHTLAEPGE
jgi:hypothetical protein